LIEDIEESDYRKQPTYIWDKRQNRGGTSSYNRFFELQINPDYFSSPVEHSSANQNIDYKPKQYVHRLPLN